MDKREVKLDYFIYENSFPEQYQELCNKAVEATRQAYSIYSHFSVGAAVLLDNNEVVVGTNQENVAYPSGICAERTALFYAGSTWPGIGVKAIAVAASCQGKVTDHYTPPCGACRQVMAEMVKRYCKDFDVVMVGAKQCVQIKASALLPFSFDFGSK